MNAQELKDHILARHGLAYEPMVTNSRMYSDAHARPLSDLHLILHQRNRPMMHEHTHDEDYAMTDERVVEHDEFDLDELSPFRREGAKHLFAIAGGLLADPSDPNPEYERGMAELITEHIGLPLGEGDPERVLAYIRKHYHRHAPKDTVMQRLSALAADLRLAYDQENSIAAQDTAAELLDTVEELLAEREEDEDTPRLRETLTTPTVFDSQATPNTMTIALTLDLGENLHTGQPLKAAEVTDSLGDILREWERQGIVRNWSWELDTEGSN